MLTRSSRPSCRATSWWCSSTACASCRVRQQQASRRPRTEQAGGKRNHSPRQSVGACNGRVFPWITQPGARLLQPGNVEYGARVHLTAGEEVVVQEAVHVGGHQVGEAAVEHPELAQEQRHTPGARHRQQPPQHRARVHTKVVAPRKVCTNPAGTSETGAAGLASMLSKHLQQ